MGSRGKYKEWLEPDNLTLVRGWRRDGLTDQQIADKIGIKRTTIYAWRDKYKDFDDAYKKGSEVSLVEVENALYKSAIGYDVTETEQEEVTYPDDTVLTRKRARKRHIPPNTGALCFLLKNRMPEKWKDRQLIESQNDGMLAQLIDGLKQQAPQEEVVKTIEVTETVNADDLHAETVETDAVVAEQ